MVISHSVPLVFHWTDDQPRTGEPVQLGLPWPRGAVFDDRLFQLLATDGRPAPLQSRVLDRWSDGSIRWCLFDFTVDRDFGSPAYRIELTDVLRVGEDSLPNSGVIRMLDFGQLAVGVDENLLLIMAGEQTWKLQINCILAEPETLAVWDFKAQRMEEGPLRSRLRVHGPLLGQGDWSGKLELQCDLDFHTASRVVRARLMIRNTLPADHPGGNWDLGNAGSVYIRELSVELSSEELQTALQCLLSLRPGDKPLPLSAGYRLVQHSSGGENWQSDNHLNRKRERPNRRGYTLHEGERLLQDGQRATPLAELGDGPSQIGLTMPEFWQHFPKSITAGAGRLTLGLFPRQEGEPHELQGGEQKTHTFYLAFGGDGITPQPLQWCRSPVVVHAAPEWYARCYIIPYLTPETTDPNTAYKQLVNLALEGTDTFKLKREKIDEYGWRHFGDLYGDHEAVYWKGLKPMVSHYNNQYDCVAGMLYQFLRSGNLEWYQQALQCAEHTVDIDQYHTFGDKSAYNQGLFWHTYHYAPADTGTHRSYPKSLRTGGHFDAGQDLQKMGETGQSLQKAYAVGGGPAASHNYNTGLMLAYFLTGEPSYRQAAIELAQFVIDMENPLSTPFRWLSREATGLATESGGGGYHGPGRASGNSLNALLVGHQLTQDQRFLAKAEQIIRRVASPTQDLDRLDLLNAELRWFYTMFLQALGRYLEYKIELDQLDQMYDYSQRTLLHYAGWMARHERPILGQPDRLQYPTETWAAQDMRKVEIFQYAARHADGAEREQFLERAEWFFRYVERTLSEFPTKSLCRPVILMLNFGWSRACWQTNPPPVAPRPRTPLDQPLPPWRMFTPQKAIAIRRAKLLLAAGVLTGLALLIAIICWLVLV